jgi:hypothetical protein
MTSEEQHALRVTKSAMGTLLLAASFAAEPDVWPAFVAFVERNIGREFNGTPESLSVAMGVIEGIRADLVPRTGPVS